MLTKTEKQFSLVYLILLIAELICGSVESLWQWHYFTKPMLLISLILYLFVQSKTLPIKPRLLILNTLILSLAGDIFLMFADRSPSFFMLGLISFFFAHICYCLIFFRDRIPKKNSGTLILILILYAFGLFYLLKNNLHDLLIPVIFYIFIILLMVTSAYLRPKKTFSKSFILVFIGAILFVISDSVLALNKFYRPLEFSSLMIMSTYGLAQFFIVLSLIKYYSFS